MLDLVLLHHNEPMTTSLAIAKGTEVMHKNVIELIRKFTNQLMEFGGVAFETLPPDADEGISAFETRKGEVSAFQTRKPVGGRPAEVVFLNEPQATLVLSLMRNSEIVVRFKVELVKAFFALRDQLRAQQEASAPPILSRDPAHVADLTVSGWRTFRALLGVGRSSGLTLRDSLRRANEATTRRIGINMLAEINAEDDLPPDPPDATPDLPSAARFFRDWVQGLTDYPVCPCDSAQICAAYLRWCREADAIPGARNGLSAHIAAQKGWKVIAKSRFAERSGAREEKRVRMIIPPPVVIETTCRPGADYRRSRFPSEAEWATAGYLAFADALESAT